MGTFLYTEVREGGGSMSKKLFSEEERERLSRNPCVIKVSDKAITYTDEFKRRFVEQHRAGKTTKQIFIECGFDIEVLGIKRVKDCAKRWGKAYQADGILGLSDGRKGTLGRPRKRALSPAEVIARQQAKIELLESQVELLKKLDKNERLLIEKGMNLSKSSAFELIQKSVANGHGRRVRFLCEMLSVSRSGYYNYKKSDEARLRRETSDQQAGKLIRKAFERRGFKKGSRSIRMILENEFGVVYNLKKILRLMKKFDLVCPHRKPNPYKRMAKATQEHSTLPNSLQRDFKKGVPGLVLLTDVTYLPYGRNTTAYLSTILDASTGEIMAYNLSNRLTLDLATDTVHALLKQRRLKLRKDAFIHSDQGSHYTSPVYQKLLRKNGLGQSMSRRGNCWDNAPQESFFGHMKDHVASRTCASFKDLQQAIDRYIYYYNHYRYQWGLKKMTPIQYRNHLLAVA